MSRVSKHLNKWNSLQRMKNNDNQLKSVAFTKKWLPSNKCAFRNWWHANGKSLRKKTHEFTNSIFTSTNFFPFSILFLCDTQIGKWISDIKAKAFYIDHVSYLSKAIDLTCRERICFRHAFEMIELKDFLTIKSCLEKKHVWIPVARIFLELWAFSPNRAEQAAEEAKTIKACH